jgi:hypothetical protein
MPSPHFPDHPISSQPSPLSPLEDLRAYLAWLERWSRGLEPEPSPPRPTLTLIQGGGDA